jgi:uncharacterized membrane protein YhaH (DUF805 family)
MTKKRKQKPYLLNISIWGTLIIQFLMIIAILLLLFNLGSYNELQSFFVTDHSFVSSNNFLHLSIVFLLIYAYSSIQILRRKIHGAYLFFVLSLIFILLLLYNSPIEWVNILMLMLINYIVLINKSWLKASKVDTDTDSDDNIDNNE